MIQTECAHRTEAEHTPVNLTLNRQLKQLWWKEGKKDLASRQRIHEMEQKVNWMSLIQVDFSSLSFRPRPQHTKTKHFCSTSTKRSSQKHCRNAENYIWARTVFLHQQQRIKTPIFLFNQPILQLVTFYRTTFITKIFYIQLKATTRNQTKV